MAFQTSHAMTADVVQTPVAEGSMQDIYRRLCGIHEQAAGACGALEDIGDRAFGAAPTPMSKAAETPKMAGLAYQISEVLSQVAALQERARDAIHRVSSAI